MKHSKFSAALSIMLLKFLSILFIACNNDDSKHKVSVTDTTIVPRIDTNFIHNLLKNNYNVAMMPPTEFIHKLLKDNYNIAMVPPTEEIPSTDVDSFRAHFQEKYSSLKDVHMWVDKSVIFSAFADSLIDGFIISPICYSHDGESRNGFKYKKDDVGFIITLTKPTQTGGYKHDGISSKTYDFNNPCPNYPKCR